MISTELADAVGLLGVLVYLGSYAVLQLGLINGQSYLYASLNILAASCVLFSLTTAYNTSSMLIQVFWIIISIAGISRLFILTRMARFTDEEASFIETHLPSLPKHLARKLLNLGRWIDMEAGTTLAKQNEVLQHLVYLSAGEADVDVDGRHVGESIGGTYIGELSSLKGEPATATVTINRPSRCMLIDVENLRKLISRNSAIDLAISSSFSLDAKAKLAQRNTEFLKLRGSTAPLN